MPHRACLPMNYKSNICEKERISHSWTDAILLPISCKLNSINFLSDNHQANLTEEAGIKPATKFSLDNHLSKKMNFMLNLANYMKELMCSRSSYDKSTSVFEQKLVWSPFSQVGFLWNFDFKKEPTRRRSLMCTHGLFILVSGSCHPEISFVVFNRSNHILFKKVRI